MQESACGVAHAYAPDERFCCKMRHMRLNGVGVSIPRHFKAATDGGYTQREMLNETFQGEREGKYELRKAR